jgi:histidinol dehydrogenase/leucyl-tRNA synthetase/ATP-dependent DNA helicase RecG
LRAGSTESELRLWSCLVNGKLGVPFCRQYVIGQRIVDFVALSLRLVVEVDGASHAGRKLADQRKDRDLHRLGYRVVRVEGAEVMRDLAGVVARIREEVERVPT